MQAPMLFGVLAVVIGAVVLIARRLEVRLVLLGAGILLSLLAGQPLAIPDAFTRGMVAPMVAPICAAMGFAAVVHASGCDRHLVQLLLLPIRKAPWLVVPGGIAAAYAVNAAIPSQTSTAAAMGPILVPLLIASGLSAEAAGAALILGASFGGDLLSPGAQDVQAVAGSANLAAAAVTGRVVPASLAGLAVAALCFTWLQRRAGPLPTSNVESEVAESGSTFRPNPLRAVLPLLPILLLLAASTGWHGLAWLLDAPPGDAWKPIAAALPVVRAMLIGTVITLAAGWREIQANIRSFFEGMGQAYGSIISLTIAAQCFGAGLGAAGVSEAMASLLAGTGPLAHVLAVTFPWGLAVLSGSGSGPVLTFAQTLLPHAGAGSQAELLASLACLGGAFGRTMSPVAAVVVYTAGLVGCSPVPMIRKLLPALLAGAAAAIAILLLAQFGSR